MAGLVADYGSESESDDSASSPNTDSNKVTELPKPKFETGSGDGHKERSVFVNPFAEADKAEKAILERHVKMISVDVKTVNGKKICWNYRKNKCRFGHNCKYAHDSDLQIDKSTIVPSETNVRQVDANFMGHDDHDDGGGGPQDESGPVKKKKRPGMAQDIVPSKKVMKMYNRHKNRNTST